MRLRVARPPAAGDHDVADEPADSERANLGALGRKPAVRDDPDRDAPGRPPEKSARVRTQADVRSVAPVDAEKFSNQPGRQSPSFERAVEDELALARVEPAPRVLEESAHAELAPDEIVDRAKAAQHVVALEVKRVVQIEDDEPVHRGSMRSGAICRPMISMSYRSMTVSGRQSAKSRGILCPIRSISSQSGNRAPAACASG